MLHVLFTVYASPNLVSKQDAINTYYVERRTIMRNMDENDTLVQKGGLFWVWHDTWSYKEPHVTGKCRNNGLLVQYLILQSGRSGLNRRLRTRHSRSGHWHILDYIIVWRRDIRDMQFVLDIKKGLYVRQITDNYEQIFLFVFSER